jgi:hypothetical protein
MAQTTQIDPEVFNKVIQGHQDVHQFITQQQGRIANEVADAQTHSSGAMISSLVNVHTDWNTKMDDVLSNLEQMIGDLTTTRDKLFAQDDNNTVRS